MISSLTHLLLIINVSIFNFKHWLLIFSHFSKEHKSRLTGKTLTFSKIFTDNELNRDIKDKGKPYRSLLRDAVCLCFQLSISMSEEVAITYRIESIHRTFLRNHFQSNASDGAKVTSGRGDCEHWYIREQWRTVSSSWYRCSWEIKISRATSAVLHLPLTFFFQYCEDGLIGYVYVFPILRWNWCLSVRPTCPFEQARTARWTWTMSRIYGRPSGITMVSCSNIWSLISRISPVRRKLRNEDINKNFA